MFSFCVPNTNARDLMLRAMEVKAIPHYEQISVTSCQYSEWEWECSFEYLYKIESFRWLWHLITPKIYKEMVSIRNDCVFHFSSRKMDFVITPKSKKYYHVQGHVSFLEGADQSVLVFGNIDKIVFKDILKKLPSTVQEQIERHIHKQIENDLKIIIS